MQPEAKARETIDQLLTAAGWQVCGPADANIAANLGIEPDDFEYALFAREGGLGEVHQLFGDDLVPIIADLATAIASPIAVACSSCKSR